MKKLLLLIRFLVALFAPTETDKLSKEMDRLNEKIQKKRWAMSDAMWFGDTELYHKFRAEWLQLCREYGRLRSRQQKDSHS